MTIRLGVTGLRWHLFDLILFSISHFDYQKYREGVLETRSSPLLNRHTQKWVIILINWTNKKVAEIKVLRLFRLSCMLIRNNKWRRSMAFFPRVIYELWYPDKKKKRKKQQNYANTRFISSPAHFMVSPFYKHNWEKGYSILSWHVVSKF